MNYLIAQRILDSWSIIHLLGWYLIVTILNISKTSTLTLLFFIGVGWEIIEPLFGIKEALWNSLVTDLTMNLLGIIMGVWCVKRYSLKQNE